nr:thiopurine S-methyltransferase-like [Hydra vulgaris]
MSSEIMLYSMYKIDMSSNTSNVDKREELNEYWCNRWANGNTTWVLPGVNPFLKLYFTVLTGGQNFCEKRVLVPLCGKTPDLLWLCEQGLSVTGGLFDFCWDINSLSAMIPDEQQIYVDKLVSFLSSNAHIILNCFEYDVALRGGNPPHVIFRNRLEKMFGSSFIYEELCRNTEDKLPDDDIIRKNSK